MISNNPSLDQRLYKALSSDEVAVIWIDDLSSNETHSPCIVVWGKSFESHRIYHYYGYYDPLRYPLLFPHGDCGWHQGLRKASDGQRQLRQSNHNHVTQNVAQSVEELLLDKAIG